MGKAYSFDGNDYIAIANPYGDLANATFTVECLIKTTNTAYARIFNMYKSGSHEYLAFTVGYENTNGEACLEYRTGNSAFNRVSSTVDINDGEIHRLSAVINSSTNAVKFYVDGVLKIDITDTDFNSSYNMTNITFNLGRETTGNNYYTGMLDDFRCWNIARSQTEIQGDLYDSLQGNESGLIGYWGFDASDATDDSPSSNNGTVYGCTVVGGLASDISVLTVTRRFAQII